MPIRSGSQYLSNLKDSRSIIFEGQKFTSIFDHPYLEKTAESISRYYDFQQHTASENAISISFRLPTSKTILRQKAEHFSCWSMATSGWMARSPDYTNQLLSAIAANSVKFSCPQTKSNILSHYQRISQEDLCLSHAFVNYRGSNFDNKKTYLRIVKENDNGIWVCGYRQVATMGVFSDELLCMQPHPTQLTTETSDGAVAFIISSNTPGLTWLCRKNFLSTNATNHPLSSLWDELDCTVIFDNCFIPNDRIFIKGNLDDYNKQGSFINLMPHAALQVCCRLIAKTRFLFGIAHMVAEYNGKSQDPFFAEKLSDFVITLQALESFKIALIEGATIDPITNFYTPNSASASALLRLFPSWMQTMREHLLTFGATGLITTPMQENLLHLEPHLNDVFNNKKGWKKHISTIYRLIWDITATEWGIRQELFDQRFFGDPLSMKISTYQLTKKANICKQVFNTLKNPYILMSKNLPNTLNDVLISEF